MNKNLYKTLVNILFVSGVLSAPYSAFSAKSPTTYTNYSSFLESIVSSGNYTDADGKTTIARWVNPRENYVPEKTFYVDNNNIAQDTKFYGMIYKKEAGEADTEGYIKGGLLSLDINLKNNAYGIGVFDSKAEIDVGKNININMSYTADNDSPRAGIAVFGEKANLMIKANEINVGVSGYSHAVVAHGTGNKNTKSGVLSLNANDKISLINNSTDWATVHVDNHTTDAENENMVKLDITAPTINIEGNGIAVAAMNEGFVDIKGNATISADNAIVVRGDSKVYINENTNNTLQMTGNINFNYDKDTASDVPVDSTVKVTLAGEDSRWQGNTVVSYSSGAVDEGNSSYMDVKNMSLTMKDGAVWDATTINSTSDGATGVFYVPINNLTINKGTVNISDSENGITAETINIADASFKGPLNMKKMTVLGGSSDFYGNVKGIADNAVIEINKSAILNVNEDVIVGLSSRDDTSTEDKTRDISIVNSGAINLYDGVVVGDIRNSGTIIVSGRTLSVNSVSGNGDKGVGDLKIADTGVFNIDADFDWNINKIINDGTLTVANLKNTIALENNGILNIASSMDRQNQTIGGTVNVNTGTLKTTLKGVALTVANGATAELKKIELSESIVNRGTLGASDKIIAKNFTNYENAIARIVDADFSGNIDNRQNAKLYMSGIVSAVSLINAGEAHLYAGFNGDVLNTETGNITFDDKLTGNLNNEGGKVTLNKGIQINNDTINNGGLLTINALTSDTISLVPISGGGELVLNGGNFDLGDSNVLKQSKITINGNLFVELTHEVKYRIIADEITGSGKVKLLVPNEEGMYTVFQPKKFDTIDFSGSGITMESATYDIFWMDGNLIVRKKTIEKLVDDYGISQEGAKAVNNAASSTSDSLQDLSIKIQEVLLKEDTSVARKEVERMNLAIHPEKELVRQGFETTFHDNVVDLAALRMGTKPTIGRSGGDIQLNSGGVWTRGLFNKSKYNDGFDGLMRGIAAGFDGTINKYFTVGAGYAYSHSDVTGSERETEINNDTMFLYSQYKPNNWYVNAIISYGMSDYSENGTAVGTPVTANYDLGTFGAIFSTGYDFPVGITPELNLRYMYISSEKYTNSVDIKNYLNNLQFLTAMFGTKYAFPVIATKNTVFIPQINAALKYDMLSDKSMITVEMPGVDAYMLDGGRLSRLGSEFGIGLAMKHRDLEISINYDIDVREDFTSQTGMLKVVANF